MNNRDLHYFAKINPLFSKEEQRDLAEAKAKKLANKFTKILDLKNSNQGT